MRSRCSAIRCPLRFIVASAALIFANRCSSGGTVDAFAVTAPTTRSVCRKNNHRVATHTPTVVANAVGSSIRRRGRITRGGRMDSSSRGTTTVALLPEAETLFSDASSLLLSVAVDGNDDIASSRIAFFIWFFGASGARGIATSSFPKLYESASELRSLSGTGQTEGGETVGLSPLIGYPEDPKVADIRRVIDRQPLTVEGMVKKFPVPDNFLSANGYLTFEAFAKANEGANPLAVRAVFESLGSSSEVVDPRQAQDRLDSYRNDLNAFKNALLVSKLTGYGAVAVLIFLLGLADLVAANYAYHGWFPDWPGGGDNFPASLFDADIGPWTIPEYWLSD